MSAQEPAHQEGRCRRLMLVVEVAISPGANDGEVAADVAMAIELGGVADLRSCAVSIARPTQFRSAR